jgi:ubiquinol-cytochrome c reductase cytochrome b/c1 subunit
VKDMYGIAVFLIFYAMFVFFAPNVLGDVANYIEANPLQTPAHIVPEWYFLPYYAILRSIDNKLIGVIAMFGSLLILFLLPWLDTSRVRSARFRPIYKWVFWLFVIDCVALTWAGAKPPEGVPLWVARIGTLYYFAHFFVVLPVIGFIERPLALPKSISTPVLAGGKA